MIVFYPCAKKLMAVQVVDMLRTHLKNVDVRCTSALKFEVGGGDSIRKPIGVFLNVERDERLRVRDSIGKRVVVGLVERITMLMVSANKLITV